MKIFEVWHETVSSEATKISQIVGSKSSVVRYLQSKLGEAYTQANLRKKEFGYSYEVKAFNYFHFTDKWQPRTQGATTAKAGAH